MKKHLFYIIAVAMAISSCTKDNGFDMKPNIIMTTAKSETVWFCLTGTGNAIIDWGDGTKSDITLSQEALGSEDTQFSYDYSDTTVRNITIAGGNITEFNCTGILGLAFDNQLTKLDVSNATALTVLHCTGNQLINLNISNNNALTGLYCTGNQLTSLDVSNNKVLRYLDCSNNQLTGLDISSNIALTHLSCSNNQLTNIDVSNNIALLSLYCGYNWLTSLNTSENNMLFQFSCVNNYMDAAALDAMFETLHAKDITLSYNGSQITADKFVSIANNGPNYDGSGTNGCDKSIATSKGWKVNTAE